VAVVRLSGEELRTALETVGRASVELDVLAPTLASRSHQLASDIDREREKRGNDSTHRSRGQPAKAW
jgi:hypothetical protein